MGFSIATFNARDFFDDAAPHAIADLDDGGFGEREQALARELYARKLDAMADVLRRLDADIVAFQEVKNARVLDDLRARLPEREGVPSGGYGPAHVAKSDHRGIACGLLTRFPVVRTAEHAADDLPFPAFLAGDPAPFAGRLQIRRPVLEAELKLPDGTPLVLFVLHFKSQRSTFLQDAAGNAIPPRDHAERAEADVRSAIARIAEALFVRRLVDERLREDPRAQLAVAGDFNDVDGSLTVRTVAGSAWGERLLPLNYGKDGAVVFDDRLYGRALYHCARAVAPDARHSLLYTNRREQLDHILVSRALWSRFQTARFLNEMLPEDSASLEVPGAFAVVSDHAPLLACFT